MNIKPIYQPRGRAGEYSPLALNLYKGCGHNCVYCYAPSILNTEPDEFHQNPQPRAHIIEDLERGARNLQQSGLIKPVLLCFTCDPYQPIDVELRLTRQAITVLHRYNIPVQILTKGGNRATRDFDLLTPQDYFAATLTFISEELSLEYEPLAAPPSERIAALSYAKRLGVQTWVSLEPVINPEASLDLIAITHDFVDLFKVGKLNYHPLAGKIDWHKFAADAVATLKKYGCRYYLKKDLERYLNRGA